jgi:hypothetical protein
VVVSIKHQQKQTLATKNENHVVLTPAKFAEGLYQLKVNRKNSNSPEDVVTGSI